MQAILCAGLYPNVATIEGGNTGSRPVWFDGKREVYIHPTSVNSSQKAFQYPFVAFLEKVQTLLTNINCPACLGMQLSKSYQWAS